MIYPYRQRLVSQPYLVRLRGGNPQYPFRPHHVDAVEKPFSQPTCRCQYCERITPDEQYSPRLAGRSFRFIWRRRVLNLLCDWVWMPKYAMAFAGMAESDALKTISYYSMGSLVCVFIFAALLKKWFALSGPMFSMPGWRHSPLRQFTCIPLH